VRKLDEYRAKAAECRERAAEAKDAEAKEFFKRAAREWDALADDLERHGLGRDGRLNRN
jgi:hypothetical protein